MRARVRQAHHPRLRVRHFVLILPSANNGVHKLPRFLCALKVFFVVRKLIVQRNLQSQLYCSTRLPHTTLFAARVLVPDGSYAARRELHDHRHARHAQGTCYLTAYLVLQRVADSFDHRRDLVALVKEVLHGLILHHVARHVLQVPHYVEGDATRVDVKVHADQHRVRLRHVVNVTLHELFVRYLHATTVECCPSGTQEHLYLLRGVVARRE
jgi:hypothetical protein